VWSPRSSPTAVSRHRPRRRRHAPHAGRTRDRRLRCWSGPPARPRCHGPRATGDCPAAAGAATPPCKLGPPKHAGRWWSQRRASAERWWWRARSMQQDPYQQRESAGTGRHARRQRKRMQRSCSRLWGGRRGGRREAHEDGTRAPRRTFARATSLGFLDRSGFSSLRLSFFFPRAPPHRPCHHDVSRAAPAFYSLPSVQYSHPCHTATPLDRPSVARPLSLGAGQQDPHLDPAGTSLFDLH
jgi:hypothetical protein